MIMKLHTLTHHESRMRPIDFEVKRSKVKVMAHGYLKMVHRNNGCRFEFVGVGGGPVLLQQYFQYAFTCCPYMLPLLFFLCLVVDCTLIISREHRMLSCCKMMRMHYCFNCNISTDRTPCRTIFKYRMYYKVLLKFS